MTATNRRILIVDDEEIVRKSCIRILSSKDYALETANDGSDALKKLKTSFFDLALTDLIMPNITGMELLKEIKKEWNETEVIIITGYATFKTAVEALKYGAYDYIEKPFTPDVLINVVERCLEKKGLMEENLRLKESLNAIGGLQKMRDDVPKTLEELKMKKKDLRFKSVEEIEKDFLLNTLERNNWNISKAAREVGMQRTNLHALMKKYNISKIKG